MSFGSRARVAMQAYGPACIGIDPHAALLEQWGLDDDIEGLDRFASICVEAFAGQVAFVKPQSAFFERFGARGVVVLERTIEDLRHTGSLVVLDVKRGDIGSTAAAYADAYLDDDSPMAADAITVSPFLGFGSLAPFFDVAEKNDAGVFVLALTSNPEGPEVQHARVGDGTVAGSVLSQLAAQRRRDADGFVRGRRRRDDRRRRRRPGDQRTAAGAGLRRPGRHGRRHPQVVRRRHRQRHPLDVARVLSAGPDVSALRDAAARVNAELVGS
ncbi:orotidine-5'-phosphate decarboxylase [Aeromicrobium sp. UC242_57]|uniref:orotidine-5'-phosphate decarboxylase n=1 Tax=Aeromicrobium sp. UC242_57 TaxID=3374624 RepID=UPI0037A5F4B2